MDFSAFDNVDQYIVLDTETNGFYPSNSVLQLCAIKYKNDQNGNHVEVDRFNRYYFSVEPYNDAAINVNGLTESEIKKRRGENCTYPEYFKFDVDFFPFCSDVQVVVGHNIPFDLQRIPILKNRLTFDTMHRNTDVIKLPRKSSNGYKVPKLSEACEFYGVVNLHEHDALGDVLATADILHIMMENYGYKMKPSMKKVKSSFKEEVKVIYEEVKVVSEEEMQKLREAIEW